MTFYVVDPADNECYGKYDMGSPPDHVPEDEIVQVDDIDKFDVVDWRYEDQL